MRLVIEVPQVDIPLTVTDVILLAIAFLLLRVQSQIAQGIALFKEQAITQKRLAAEISARTDSARTDSPTKPRPLPAKAPQQRLLRKSAHFFADCMLDEDDVDVTRFIATCRNFTEILTRLGPFTMLSIREVNSNMTKVEHTYLLAPERFRSMRALLEEEIANQMHSAGGILADPSAAMGLLWARRGLMFWVKLFEPHILEWTAEDGSMLTAPEHEAKSKTSSPKPARPPTPREQDSAAPSPSGGIWGGLGGVLGAADQALSSQGYNDAMAAYEASIGPWLGWMSANTFKLSARATPDWPTVSSKLAPSDELMMEDVRLWSESATAVLDRMHAMLTELDLQDTRKTI